MDLHIHSNRFWMLQQPFSTSAPLTFGLILCCGAVLGLWMLSSISGLCPRDDSHTPTHTYDQHNLSQALPNVPWGPEPAGVGPIAQEERWCPQHPSVSLWFFSISWN